MKTVRLDRPAAAICLLLAVAWPVTVGAQEWTFLGVVADGEQCDAVAGPSGKIHLVSSRYYQLDGSGSVILEEDHGDPVQGALFFPPAIAVDSGGSVHLVTRDSGDYNTGYVHGHHRRQPDGGWTSYTYNTPTRWNFLVGAAADGQGHVHLMSGHPGTDVWADLQIYQDSGGSAAFLGAVTGVYRADFDARLRGGGGKIYLGTGNYIPGSTAMFSHGDGGPGLVAQLQANLQHLTAGTGAEKGFPDLAVDGRGQVHFTYGSGHTDHNQFPASTAGCVPGEVHYTKFSAAGARLFPSDQTLFTGLGVWHISIGLSAVAAADDGETVVAVALRVPDQKEGWNSELLWAASTDGGATWSAPRSLGVNTNAGEGRQRPRLVALGSTFFLFYRDAAVPGISLARIVFPETVVEADAEFEPDAEVVEEDSADGDGVDQREILNDGDGVDQREASSDGDVADQREASTDGDGVEVRDDSTDLEDAPVGDSIVTGGCSCRSAGPPSVDRGAGLLLFAGWLVLYHLRMSRRSRLGRC